MMDIVLQNICKSYGPKQILKDFSCRIPAGSICAVTAPSGTGKTTLLRLILGLEKPDSGTVTGVPQRKSALFQEDRLCPNLTVLGNLRMVLPHREAAEVTEVLAALGLADSLDQPASQLSGGMARRVALARALLYDSALLVLDEPFTGLDDANRQNAADIILQYRNGRTTLVVTHRSDELKLLNAEHCISL